MTPDATLAAKLRRYLDEKIPPGGTDADTRFTNTEIDDLLTENTSLEAAAAAGWEEKAAKAFSERGGMVSHTAGDESTKWADPTAYRDHCLAMVKVYTDKANDSSGAGSGSRLFGIESVDVLGTGGGAG
jgi:hypothetical protein